MQVRTLQKRGVYACEDVNILFLICFSCHLTYDGIDICSSLNVSVMFAVRTTEFYLRPADMQTVTHNVEDMRTVSKAGSLTEWR